MKRTPLARVSASTAEGKPCVDCGGPVAKRTSARCKRCAAILNGQKAAVARRALRRPDVERECANCGQRFTVRPFEAARGHRFCSQRCMGEANRKPRVCAVCGRDFWVRQLYTKTCSRKCRSLLTSGMSNHAYVSGDRVGTKAWYAAERHHCEVCGSRRNLDFHHVVYRQHVRQAGGAEWDLRNAMTLCRRCHLDHHHAVKRIPLTKVSDEAINFTVDLLGPAAGAYLSRYYAPG